MFFDKAPSAEHRQGFFEYINQNYENALSGVLAKSILGKEIHYYKIGSGKRHILSVAAHHGAEHISAAALYSTVYKFCDNLTRTATCYAVNLEFLLQKFTFWFIPCLNPDGTDMAISGKPSFPLCERQRKMAADAGFHIWQANARGVDLNHNYDYRFYEYKRLEAKEGIVPGRTRYSGEYPESEPETRALASFIRSVSPELILSFHTQGKEIFSRPRASVKAQRIAKKAADLLGFSLSCASGLAAYGGLADYAGEVLKIPSLTVELGKGETPLPYSQLPAISEGVYKLHVLLPMIL